MTTFTSWDAELYHHGIKGQKWGIRRFQNPDGTLTEEGRAKYRKKGFYFELKNAAKQSKKDQTSSRKSEILTNHPAILEAAAKIQKYANKANQAMKEDFELMNKRRDIAIRNYRRQYRKDPESEADLYKSDPELRSHEKMMDSLISDYSAQANKMAKKLLGRYGNKKLYSNYNKYTHEKNYLKAKEIVAFAIQDAADNNYSKQPWEDHIGTITRLVRG